MKSISNSTTIETISVGTTHSETERENNTCITTLNNINSGTESAANLLKEACGEEVYSTTY